MPNLLDVQLASFRSCLGGGSSDSGEPSGLDEIFRRFFPVEGHQGAYTLEYKGFRLGQPKHTIQECRERNLTFEAPLKATLRLVRWEAREGGQRKFIEAEEAEIYLGEIPLITDRGTFVVNGAERVIVSQLHRSPGVFFQERVHPNGTTLYFAKIIPYRGTWVEIRMGIKDEMFIRTDRRHQFRMTTFLRALGYSKDEDIRALFYTRETLELPSSRPSRETPPCGRILAETIVNKATGEVVAERGEEIAPKHVKELRDLGHATVPVLVTETGRILARKEEERDAELVGRIVATTYSEPRDERDHRQERREAHGDGRRTSPEGRLPGDRARSDGPRRPEGPRGDARPREDALRGGRPSGDLQDHEGREPPEPRRRARARGPDVLRPEPVRPQERRPVQDQQAARASATRTSRSTPSA